MLYETHDIRFDQGISKLHRFRTTRGGTPVLLVHGYFEDGRIWFTKSGKGFAPYLANFGYDVFVCDLLGKGESIPKVNKDLHHSQFEIITRDIPTYIEFIRKHTDQQEIHLGGHSWGGVILFAYMARYNDPSISSIFTFGTKRRIGIKSIKKFIGVDLMWNLYGQKLANKHGYLPAKGIKMGIINEPKAYFEQANKWVYDKEWIDPEDEFNYHQAFEKINLPPTLFLTGSKDDLLGHPKDVKRLIREVKSPAVFKIIGKNNGYKNDYDHVNILTHKDSPDDHFPLVIDFIKENT